MSKPIDYLASELLAGNLAVFVGSGLSVGAGLLSWADLIRPLAEDLGLGPELPEGADLLAIAQYHCNEAGGSRARLNALIKSEFSKTPAVTPALQALAQLPVRWLWTTNYDRLLETAFSAAGKHVDVKSDEKQIPARDHKAAATLYKLHGDAGSPETATLTKGDYETFHLRHSRFLTFLSNELAQKTFLFLGFGFRDYNVDYVFGQLRAYFQENHRRHYCVLQRPARSGTETEAAFARRSRVYTLFVDDLLRVGVETIAIDSYDEVTKLLIGLRVKFDELEVDTSDPRAQEAIAVPIYAGGTPPSNDTGSGGDAELVVALQAPTSGTVYTSSRKNDDEPLVPLVASGARVKAGDNLFLLRRYNSRVGITSPIDGELVEVVVHDHSLVARGQTLCFLKRATSGRKTFFLQRADTTGIFYRSPQPKFPVYVREGDVVRRGDYLCIISAQKVLHHVTSSVNGVVRAINVENDTKIEKGQYLFGIETTGTEVALDHLNQPGLPFRIQTSPDRGRFFSTAADNRPTPLKVRGDSVEAGDVLARVRRTGGDDTAVESELNGHFLEYMKRDGEHVDLGEPIAKLVAEEALRFAKNRFRAQTSDRAGQFIPQVQHAQFVQKHQVIGAIDQVEIKSKYDGFATEVHAAGPVRINDVLLKLAM